MKLWTGRVVQEADIPSPDMSKRYIEIDVEQLFSLETIQNDSQHVTIPCAIMASRHWGLNKMADILQMAFSNTSSWMENIVFRFWFHTSFFQGAVSIRKTVLPGMAIPMLKIRRPNGRLIFNMEIAIRR